MQAENEEEKLCKCAVCGDWYPREELYYFGIDDDETGCHDVFKCGDCFELDPPVEF